MLVRGKKPYIHIYLARFFVSVSVILISTFKFGCFHHSCLRFNSTYITWTWYIPSFNYYNILPQDFALIYHVILMIKTIRQRWLAAKLPRASISAFFFFTNTILLLDHWPKPAYDPKTIYKYTVFKTYHCKNIWSRVSHRPQAAYGIIKIWACIPSFFPCCYSSALNFFGVILPTFIQSAFEGIQWWCCYYIPWKAVPGFYNSIWEKVFSQVLI